MVLDKLDILMQKNATGLKSTWIKNLHIRPNTIQVFKEDIGPNFITLKLAMILGYDTKGTGNNNKKTNKLKFIKMF